MPFLWVALVLTLPWVAYNLGKKNKGGGKMYGNFGGGYGPYAGQNPYMGNQYMERLQAMQQPQIPAQQLIRVTGRDGAMAYQMNPNEAAPLFDTNENVFFIKTTDGAGFPTLHGYRYTPIDELQEKEQFITRAEFDQFKEMLLNGTQSVQRPAADAAPADAAGK